MPSIPVHQQQQPEVAQSAEEEHGQRLLKKEHEVYPSDILKALTLMNEYRPLELDVAHMPAQGTAFATTSRTGKGKKASGGTKGISNPNGKQ